MKPIRTMLVAAIAAAGMVATVQAQSHPASRGASASGGARIHTTGTHGTWSGGGHWRGGGGHWGGGHWGGARFGLYIGAPLLWSSWYWAGYPYYYDYWGYPRTVVYDRVIERYPASYPEGVMRYAEPTTDIGPRTPGAPTEAPAYRNYCESAKAYFPKVTACPEGWRFVPAR
jgi:hypothetical protein